MKLHYRMAPQAGGSKPSLEAQRKLRTDAEDAFSVLRSDLEAARPDVLIVVANDQFVNFFFDNIPTFFVTLADEVRGQFTRYRFHYRNHPELGRAILEAGVAAGLDLSFGEDIELQHTQMVPLHFVLPEPEIPILPIFVNTWIDPLPTPSRCYALGSLIRQVADAAAERVAILATGGLSHFPGSPRIGEIDTSFDEDLLRRMRAGEGVRPGGPDAGAVAAVGELRVPELDGHGRRGGRHPGLRYVLHARPRRHRVGLRELEDLMSRYHLNRFLFDLKMKPATLDQARADLDQALSEYDLSAEEVAAVKSGDPRQLRPLGAHGMLSLYLMRLDPEFDDNIYWTQK